MKPAWVLCLLASGCWVAGCQRETARGACQPGPEAVWTELEIPGPPARLDASLAVDPARARVYLFGGRSPGGFLDDLWELDTAQSTWRRFESRGPAARSGASLIVEPGTERLILFGGYSSNRYGQMRWFNDLWVHEPGGGWRREYSPNPPPPRAWHAALVHQGAMLVLAGFSVPATGLGLHLQDVWALDLANLAWRRAATDGGPRMAGRPILQADPEGIWVFGRDGIPKAERAGFWRLDLETDRWERSWVDDRLPRTFDASSQGASGQNLLLRGPNYLEPDFLVWSVHPTRGCLSHPVTAGPKGTQGLGCVPEPGQPDGWICFGGAQEAEVFDRTWRLRVPWAGGAP
jgi:hypothetical protein